MTTAKYLAISGEEIKFEDVRSKEELIKSFTGSITPLVEIDGESYWNENSVIDAWEDKSLPKVTKKEWIKKICPQLREIYG